MSACVPAARSSSLLAVATVLTMVGSISAGDSSATGGDELRVVVEPAVVSVLRGEQPVLRYRYGNVPFKPYARELFTPAGVNILRDAPHDHLHHHGLMFALAADGMSFWAETGNVGRQVHRAIDDVKAAANSRETFARFSERIDWLAPDQKLLLRERRTIMLHGGNDIESLGATLLTWKGRLEAPPGDAEVTLTGSHYYGLGMRFLVSMDTSGTFANAAGAEGEVFRGDERLTRANWCAYTADADGKPVTVAMFDHPDNARHPATWFTMAKPFAYLSATMNLHRQPLSLEAGQSLELCYGVAVWDGHVPATRVEKVYQVWLTHTAGKR